MTNLIDELRKRTEKSLQEMGAEKADLGYLNDSLVFDALGATPLNSQAIVEGTKSYTKEVQGASTNTVVNFGQSWCYGNRLTDRGDRWIFDVGCNANDWRYLLKTQVVSFQHIGFCGQWQTYKIVFNF